MNTTQPEPSPARRAALMAHALSPQDQAWLLASLPLDRRVMLQALLTELQALGIPADEEVLDGLAPRALPPSVPRGAALLAALTRRQVRVLAQVLQGEGVAVTASLLAVRPWPWRHVLFAAMDREFAHAVRTAAAAAPPAVALEDALCAGLLHELEAAMPAPHRFSARFLWQRAGRLMRRAGAPA